MSLSLAMIVKNEENCLARVLSGVHRYVDEIIIADTGSTDRTKEIARGFNAKVLDFNDSKAFDIDTFVEGVPGPFTGQKYLCDYALARNFSFENAAGDYILWLDADDVVLSAENLPKLLDSMDANKSDLSMLPYQVYFDENDNCTRVYARERISKRDSGLRWGGPIHEAILYEPCHQILHTDSVIVQHRRLENTRPPGVKHSRIKILTKRYLSGIRNFRELFYLGNEWMQVPDVDKAVVCYEEYLNLSRWSEEICVVRNILGTIWETKGELHRAYREYATAHCEDFNNPDPLFGLARIAYMKRDLGSCIKFTEAGFNCDTSKALMPIDPVGRARDPHVCYSDALFQIGKVKEAIESCKRGLSVGACPELQANLERFRQKQEPLAQGPK